MTVVPRAVGVSPLRRLFRFALRRVLGLADWLDPRAPLLGWIWRRLAMALVRTILRLRDLRRRKPRLDPPAPEDIRLRLAAVPVVTVIIPTYGQTEFTLNCLASIQAHPPAVPIEVIVVDDAYPGPETACLRRAGGIRLWRNPVNLGFLHTCNEAARAARGDYILFLNNDTQVREGWLDHMLTLFATRPDVGAVGSKLISADGTLQEAGGIIWRDGTGWNFGRGGDPHAAAYNYPREVDYCSGASLLVRRAEFLDLDGFDPRYAPAYCEDSDLCFRLRRRGLKTWYQPRSEVVHFEGMSHGRDPGRGGKASQGVNQLTFATVWAGVLARDHFPSGTHAMRAKDRARHRKIVLIVDHYVPEPDRDAGSRTMIGFVRALLAAGLVVKFWPHNLIATPGYSQALRDLGVEVFHGPNHAPFAVWARENAADLDLVLLSRPDIATAWLPAIRACSTAKVVYYGHDLHFRRMRALGELTADETLLREAVAMRGQEAAIWRAADLSLYPSEDEAAAARALAPGADIRAVAAYGFETAPPSRDPPAAPEILFVAGFGHAPNQTAVSWFVADILPLIVAAIPGTRLAIVGADPSAEVLALRGPAIDLCANVTDAELNAWYHRARVAVVPLRAGAGVKRKTVEALWHGLPVVMTSVGAQGLDDVETVAAVADAPEAFAAAVCALLRDDALWRRRRASQIAYASDRFSEAAFRRSLLGALGIGGSAAGVPDAERNPRLRPETRHADAVPQLALGEPLSGP